MFVKKNMELHNQLSIFGNFCRFAITCPMYKSKTIASIQKCRLRENNTKNAMNIIFCTLEMEDCDNIIEHNFHKSFQNCIVIERINEFSV